ncbi:MAG: hypothetical protein ACW99A_04970 [Candidatus Kariarchaeaceae archaeon]|jgi:hypothetical protein
MNVVKLNPSDILVIGIILHIANILFTDTSSIHNISTIPNSIWISILLLFLIIASVPILWKSPPSTQNFLLTGAVLLSIVGTILRLLDFSFDLLTYRILLDLIAITTIVSLFRVKSNQGRIYVILFGLILIDLQTILFSEAYNEDLVLGISVFFEMVFLFGLLYFIYSSNFDHTKLGYLAGVTLMSVGFGSFILTKETALFILRTVIEQLLGINEFGIDLFVFEISNDNLFVIHIVEFVLLVFVLILRKPPKLFLAIILCGFNLTFPPLSGFRALAIMYYLNQNESKIDTFELTI